MEVQPYRQGKKSSNSGGGGALDKTMGNLADRTKVIAVKVGGSDTKDVDVAIIKATNHNCVTPKEKHVMTLVSACKFGDEMLIQHICSTISKRAHTLKKWLIALKACVLFHRLAREGSPALLKAASASRGFASHSLGLGGFRDSTTPSAWDFAAFIRPYSAYLDAQIETYSFVPYYPDMESHSDVSIFRQMDAASMIDLVPRILSLVKSATTVRPFKTALGSPIVQYAMILVLKECLCLYKTLSEVMLNIVDKFFDLEPSQASPLLFVYKDTIASSALIVKFMLECKDTGISQGVDLPVDLQPVPADFLTQMEDFAGGKNEEPPIYESPMRVETPRAESPVKEDTPKAESPKKPPTPPAPRELPDLMCMDTPTASEPPTPVKEEEDDVLGALWKGHGTAPNGAATNGFAASTTGFIPTKAFLAGPTGASEHPFQHAQPSNNPFLMPVPASAPPPAPAPAPLVYGHTNMLGDLGLDALGIRKPQEVEVVKQSPMRTTVPTSIALPHPTSKPQSAPVLPPPAPTPVAAVPGPALIPSNPYYQTSATGSAPGQLMAPHDPFGSNHDDGSASGPAGHYAPNQFVGGVTGYNQAVGYSAQPPPPTQWGSSPWQAQQGGAPQSQWQGGFTGAPSQSAAYGANPTGMPAAHGPLQGNQFRSAVTGPVQSNPFGTNAFGGNAF